MWLSPILKQTAYHNKRPIPISLLCLTSHVCWQIYLVNIDVPVGVGAPPLDNFTS